jgi:hypothetical protein
MKVQIRPGTTCLEEYDPAIYQKLLKKLNWNDKRDKLKK